VLQGRHIGTPGTCQYDSSTVCTIRRPLSAAICRALPGGIAPEPVIGPPRCQLLQPVAPLPRPLDQRTPVCYVPKCPKCLKCPKCRIIAHSSQAQLSRQSVRRAYPTRFRPRLAPIAGQRSPWLGIQVDPVADIAPADQPPLGNVASPGPRTALAYWRRPLTRGNRWNVALPPSWQPMRLATAA
jgi:hypothetical protein